MVYIVHIPLLIHSYTQCVVSMGMVYNKYTLTHTHITHTLGSCVVDLVDLLCEWFTWLRGLGVEG